MTLPSRRGFVTVVAVATQLTLSVAGAYAPSPARKAVKRIRTSLRTPHCLRHCSMASFSASSCNESGMSMPWAPRAACRRCTWRARNGTWPEVKRMDSNTPSASRNALLAKAMGSSLEEVRSPSTKRVSSFAMG